MLSPSGCASFPVQEAQAARRIACNKQFSCGRLISYRRTCFPYRSVHSASKYIIFLQRAFTTILLKPVVRHYLRPLRNPPLRPSPLLHLPAPHLLTNNNLSLTPIPKSLVFFSRYWNKRPSWRVSWKRRRRTESLKTRRR